MFSQFSNFFFLYYSWLEIKKYEMFLNLRVYQVYVVPVKKTWFFKVSTLLKLGLYNYPSLKHSKIPFNFNKLVVIDKTNIIENAIFNVIFPFFENYYSFKSRSLDVYFLLISYLRLVCFY